MIRILLIFNPLLAGMIVLTVLPQLYVQMKLGHQRFGLVFGNNSKERRALYYGQILSGIQFAKEVRLFSLSGHFLKEFVNISHEIYSSQKKQEKREMLWRIFLSVFASIVASGTFAFVVVQALEGHLSLGDITLYTSAVSNVQGTISAIVIVLSQMSEAVLFHKEYLALLKLPQPLISPPLLRPVPLLKSGIELRNVSFRYSEQHPWVLHQVSLFIPSGQCVALVGLNGAGKTTLVKLLMRLYDPTEGQILWDGIDIREFDPAIFRLHLGAIFQDFMHYELTAQENIGIGDITQINNSSSIFQAAKHAGVHDTIENLPEGYQTTLSRWLSNKSLGVDLSGGEWQKIALARMFMRDADLLIMDEPTSALDAQSEYDLYSHFVELIVGKTSLLITHRFSTVRMADVIAVLEEGQITEYGTHDDLLLANKMYAKLYRMQAERYQ